MPLLDHETILRSRIPSITLPSWWRQKVSKCSNKNNNNNNIHDDITNTTSIARDWRSLSPNNPPLPFVQDNDQSGTISDIYPYTQTSERAPKRLPIPKKYRHSSYDDDQLQKLSTIIEESDLLTEISLSPKNSSHHHHRQRQRQRDCDTTIEPTQHSHDKNDDITIVPSPPLPPNDSPHPSSTGSTSPNDATFSCIESPSPTNTSSFIELSSSTRPSFSNDSIFHPTTTATEMIFPSSATYDSSSSYPTVWPTHVINPKDCNHSSIPTTAEIDAKQELINMIHMVYKFRLDNQSSIPSKMEILFDSQDNVHKIQIWIQDKFQSHVFQGDAQYFPPELPIHRTYDCDRVDVWVLGISLYRMLVGKYPFQANNDRRLFSKMQHADFGIPSHLSTDVKDLLRRMLAPDHSRASLDLVMFHPWLKPYSTPPHHNTIDRIKQSSSLSKPTTTTSSSSSRAVQQDIRSTMPSLPSTHHHPKRRKKSIVSKLKKVFTFMVQGPCPPPTYPYRDLCPGKFF